VAGPSSTAAAAAAAANAPDDADAQDGVAELLRSTARHRSRLDAILTTNHMPAASFAALAALSIRTENRAGKERGWGLRRRGVPRGACAIQL
jgi:hypothetical protein